MPVQRWKRSSFETRASQGRIIHHYGYVNGSFGISGGRRDREWCIYHLPTGMEFLYSYWSTFGDAERFADALLAKSSWEDSQLDSNPEEFNKTCHTVAADLGCERRKLTAIA